DRASGVGLQGDGGWRDATVGRRRSGPRMTLIQRIRANLIRVDPFYPYHPWSIAEVINVTTSNNRAGSPPLTRRDLLRGAVAAASLSALSDAASVLASSETKARS